MDKQSIGYIPGKGNPLDKKVPQNPKYINIGPTISTGKTIKDVEIISDKSVAKRRGEIFKRIKPSTIANLLKEDKHLESIYKLNTNNNNNNNYTENIYNNEYEDNRSIFSLQSDKSKVSQESHFSAITYATDQLGLTDSSNFLLLDLREPEEFELFHIVESFNYPAPNIPRDKMIPELFKFKNKEGKVIIIYGFDEKAGIPSATIMAEKGYENVYLLSGGLEAFLQEFPEFIEGKKVPVLPKQEKKAKTLVKRSSYIENKGDVYIEQKTYEENKIDFTKKNQTGNTSKNNATINATTTKNIPANASIKKAPAKQAYCIVI